MNQENFVYWLNGMLEYMDIDAASEDELREKLEGIRDHLDLVFEKVTPVRREVPKENINPISVAPTDTSGIDWEAITKQIEKELNKKKIIFPPSNPYKPGPYYTLGDFGLLPEDLKAIC